MEVMATSPNISFFHCLHDFGVFHTASLYGVGSQIRFSRGAFAPRDPWVMNHLVFFPRTSYPEF